MTIRTRGDKYTIAEIDETSQLKSVAVSGSWLAKESQPDIAVQVSRAPQSFPQPTVGQIKEASTMVKRALQFHDTCLHILPISLSDPHFVVHNIMPLRLLMQYGKGLRRATSLRRRTTDWDVVTGPRTLG